MPDRYKQTSHRSSLIIIIIIILIIIIIITTTTRMWANNQRDRRPAEHRRWRPLFNAAKFG